MTRSWLGIGALAAASLCLVPLVFVAGVASTGTLETVSQLADTVLWRYTGTTLLLVVVVGLG
ncbi:MAG: iron ABC transporter permease, partial [Pseudomonadota bacterium]